jgi:hypothetical protein
MNRWHLMIMLQFCICAIALEADGSEKEKQGSDLQTVSVRRKNMALSSILQYKGRYFSKEEVLGEKYDDLRSNINAYFCDFLPRFICDTARIPDGEKALLLFETDKQNAGLWALNAIDNNWLINSRQYGAKKIVFDSAYNVVSCGVSNCFNSLSSDTLWIKTSRLQNDSEIVTTNIFYFTLVRRYDELNNLYYSIPLLVRAEDQAGVSQYKAWFTHRELIDDADIFSGAITQTVIVSGTEIQTTQKNFTIENKLETVYFDDNHKAHFLENCTTPELLNQFLVLIIDLNDAPKNRFVRNFQGEETIVENAKKLLSHTHPWVRESAKHYMGCYQKSKQAHEKSKEPPPLHGK